MKFDDHIAPQIVSGIISAFCALVVGVTVAGCGASHTESGSSSARTKATSTPAAVAATQTTNTVAATTQTHGPAEPAPPPVTVKVTIPGLLPKYRIPKRYTCDGSDTSLPLRWTDIPPGTEEIAVFVIASRPLNGRPLFNWAVTGITPTSGGLSSGKLPSGAEVGRNSYGDVGYSICPVRHVHEEQFYVRVVAMSRRLEVSPGIGAEAMYRRVERSARAVGLTAGEYERL
jgi:phosphatidylethanolamine-binding protein (PEBP) family uncharacterized protein